MLSDRDVALGPGHRYPATGASEQALSTGPLPFETGQLH